MNLTTLGIIITIISIIVALLIYRVQNRARARDRIDATPLVKQIDCEVGELSRDLGDVRKTVEEILEHQSESVPIESRLREAAKEQGKTLQKLKDEIGHWVEQVKTPYEKGLAALYHRKYHEAEKHFTESIESSKQESAKKYFYLGFAQDENKKYDPAIASYKTAINIIQDYASAHNNLGTIYGKQDRYDPAIASFRTVINIDPDYALAHYNLGIIYGKQGLYYQEQNQHALANASYELAIASYETAININSEYASAHNNLGSTYERIGKDDSAITSFKAAININPEHAGARYNLGLTYERQGQYPLAIASYKAAIDIEPTYASAHYGLACVYSLNNEKDLSLESLQKAIALDEYYIEAAKKDSNFSKIRGSPEFQLLIR